MMTMEENITHGGLLTGTHDNAILLYQNQVYNIDLKIRVKQEKRATKLNQHKASSRH